MNFEEIKNLAEDPLLILQSQPEEVLYGKQN